MSDQNHPRPGDPADDFWAKLGACVLKSMAVAAAGAIAGPVGAAIAAVIVGSQGDGSSGDCSC